MTSIKEAKEICLLPSVVLLNKEGIETKWFHLLGLQSYEDKTLAL